MAALSFSEAVFQKYRADQARDERGRFADEGGGGRGRRSPTKPTGTSVGSDLLRQFNRISRASRIAERAGSLAAARTSLTAVTDSVRAEANEIIDMLIKAPVVESHTAVKVINARRASSRKEALLSMRQEVLRRIHDAHKGLAARYTRPW